jgi:hypothetical protein
MKYAGINSLIEDPDTRWKNIISSVCENRDMMPISILMLIFNDNQSKYIEKSTSRRLMYSLIECLIDTQNADALSLLKFNTSLEPNNTLLSLFDRALNVGNREVVKRMAEIILTTGEAVELRRMDTYVSEQISMNYINNRIYPKLPSGIVLNITFAFDDNKTLNDMKFIIRHAEKYILYHGKFIPLDQYELKKLKEEQEREPRIDIGDDSPWKPSSKKGRRRGGR